jgi:hypothetical protein
VNYTVFPFLEPSSQRAKSRDKQNSNFSQEYHGRKFLNEVTERRLEEKKKFIENI